MTLTNPYNFTGGNLSLAAQVNSDFDTLYTGINNTFLRDTGSPLGVVTAGIGILYEDTATGYVYRNTIGSSSAGWVQITTGTGGGGGSITLTSLDIDAPYKEFYISGSGNKYINLTNYAGTNIISNTWANSGNVGVALLALAGCGTQNAGLKMGGSPDGTAAQTTVERFNGSAWSSTTVMGTAKQYTAGCGTQNSALNFGGSASIVTEKFNGTNWNATGSINSASYIVGCGVQNAALKWDNSTADVQIFNGATWATSGSYSANTSLSAGCGTQNSGLKFGGTTSNTEKFNGSTWITLTSWNLINGRYGLAGGGVQNSGLSFGGQTSLVYAEKFNGSTWSSTGNLNTGRHYLAGCGTQGAGLSFGGQNAGASAITERFTGEPKFSYHLLSSNNDRIEIDTLKDDLNTFEIYCPAYVTVEIRPQSNGLTEIDQNDLATLGFLDDVVGGVWTASNNLNTGRSHSAGAGFENSGLSFGGWTGANSAVTEKFNGTTWTNSGALGAARGYLAGCGVQNSGLSFGGITSTTTTEKFNGSTWSTSTGWNLGTGRWGLRGAGTQTAALSFGGYNPGTSAIVGITEKFNGSTWASSNLLNEVKYYHAGAGSQSAGLSFAGTIDGSTPSIKTEKFNGTSWSFSGALNNGRYQLAGCGSQNSALSFGGTSVSNITEKFNGATWTNTSNMVTARTALAGCGTQNGALNITGDTTGGGSFSVLSEMYNTQIPLLQGIYSSIIPVMTGNNTPSTWTISASTFVSGYEPYRAVDGVISGSTNRWQATTNTGYWKAAISSGSFIPKRVAITVVGIADGTAPKNFTFKDQSDNIFATFTNVSFPSVTQYFDISNAPSITALKIDITLANGSSDVRMVEVNIYTSDIISQIFYY